METPDTRLMRRMTHILAWIGLIVVVVLVFWGAVNAAILVSNTFSGISPEAAVTVTSKSLTGNEETENEVATSTEKTTPSEETPKTETEEETTTKPVTPGPKTTETYTFTTNGYPLNPNGRPDLVARIIGVGIIDPQTNQFFATSSAASDDRIAVKFVVENIGDYTASPWDFRVVLPTINVHFFDSPTQTALLPGESVEYVISFDGGRVGKDKDVVVNVDSGNYIKESNENNNIVKEKLTIFAAK